MAPHSQMAPTRDSNELIPVKKGAKSSKLKKLELLASKDYLNLPRHNNGDQYRDHQSKSKINDEPKSPKRHVDTGDALIETSPKRKRTHIHHHHIHHKHSVPRDKLSLIEMVTNVADEVIEMEKVVTEITEKDEHREVILEDTQDLDDIEIIEDEQINDLAQVESTDELIMKQDFPDLKIARRVPQDDKFYKSLQSEKARYDKVIKGKPQQDSSSEVENTVFVTKKQIQSVIKKSMADEKKLKLQQEKLQRPDPPTPKKRGFLKNLESSMIDAQILTDLANSPTRTRRSRNLVASPLQVSTPKPKPLADATSESNDSPSPEETKTAATTLEDNTIKSSIKEEMDSLIEENRREVSPTPIKRKQRALSPLGDRQELIKKITLLHSQDSKALFESPTSQGVEPEEFNFEPLEEPEDQATLPQGSKSETNSLLNELLHDLQFQLYPTKDDVHQLKKIVLKRLTQQISPLELYGLEDHYHQLYRMIRNTITNLEGNSCLMIGPSGTGKRTMINKVITDLNNKYSKQFITIRLSGAVQTDEKLAIRSIAEQIDDAISKYVDSEQQDLKITDLRNSNRTLRALLKVLDHNDLNEFRVKSIDRNLSVAIVFVIDEFHKFTEYNRQSLLYNLFDLSQNSDTPIAVVGLTTKITTREMLEKRVKSRFSQKIIMFNKPFIVEDFIEQFLQNCTVDSSEVANTSYAKAYNSYCIKLAKTIDAALHKHLVVNYYTIKSIKESMSSLIVPIAQLETDQPFPDFSFMLNGEDPYSNEIPRKIESLSDLELSLLLACCRIVFKSELNIVDFNSCYSEYHDAMRLLKQERISSMTDFNSSTGVVIDLKIWSKQNSKKAWESLQQLGLIVESSIGTGFQSNKKASQSQASNTFNVVVTLEELKKSISKQSSLYLFTTI